MVVLAADDQDVCAIGAVAEYISVGRDIGWDLSFGYLVSEPTPGGRRGSSRLTAMEGFDLSALHGHLRAAGLSPVTLQTACTEEVYGRRNNRENHASRRLENELHR